MCIWYALATAVFSCRRINHVADLCGKDRLRPYGTRPKPGVVHHCCCELSLARPEPYSPGPAAWARLESIPIHGCVDVRTGDSLPCHLADRRFIRNTGNIGRAIALRPRHEAGRSSCPFYPGTASEPTFSYRFRVYDGYQLARYGPCRNCADCARIARQAIVPTWPRAPFLYGSSNQLRNRKGKRYQDQPLVARLAFTCLIHAHLTCIKCEPEVL
jgi:hypothetical protein